MKIGIIGAGMIGSTVGKLWIDAGHDVRFASRHPDELKPLAARLGKRASAGTPADAAAFGEVVMLSIPLSAVPGVARDLAPSLAGKVVLNTVNFKTLQKEAHRDGDKIGIPLAGDDPEAVDTAARLVRDAGFDPVTVGALARGKEFQPDTKPYNSGMSGREVRRVLGV